MNHVENWIPDLSSRSFYANGLSHFSWWQSIFSVVQARNLGVSHDSFIPSPLTSCHILSHISSQSIRISYRFTFKIHPEPDHLSPPSLLLNWSKPALSPAWITAIKGFLTGFSAFTLLSLAVSLFSQKQPESSFLNVSQIMAFLCPNLTMAFLSHSYLYNDLTDCLHPQLISDLIFDPSPSVLTLLHGCTPK